MVDEFYSYDPITGKRKNNSLNSSNLNEEEMNEIFGLPSKIPNAADDDFDENGEYIERDIDDYEEGEEFETPDAYGED